MKNYFFSLKIFYICRVSLILLLGVTCFHVSAQNTIAIACTGTSGSFKSGSVNAAGTKADGALVSVSNIGSRGWSTYNLASLAGAIIISVTVDFTTYSSGTSTAGNWLKGFTGNPATLSGTALYDSCFTGPTLHFSSWSTNALQSEELNAAGLAFVQANVGGSINIGYTRNSGVIFNIRGYNATSSERPRLIITYYKPGNCFGVPAPGNTISSSLNVCTEEPFLLSVENPMIAGAYAYQWMVADDSAFSTNVINLGTDSIQTARQTSAKYYRCKVTCTNGLAIGYTAPVHVTMASGISCPSYCTNIPTSNLDRDIKRFGFWGINSNTSTCSSLAPGPGSIQNRYSNYKSGTGAPEVAIVTRTQVVDIDFIIDDCIGSFSGAGRYASVYIDYNQNGLFTDVGEHVFYASTPNLGVQPGAYISIPVSASLGTTVMRAVSTNEVGAPPCSTTSGTYGETEDYYIQIVDVPKCNGVPSSPGNTIASNTQVCPNSNVTLSLQNLLTVQGISYQWYNNAGAVAGATNSTYTATMITSDNFYCMITCANSLQTASSNPVAIIVNPIVTTSVTPSTTGCAGTTFTINASGASSYIWQPGSLNGSTVVVTPSSTTTYTITGTSAQGCTSSSTRLITINTVGNPNVTTSVTPSATGCVGTTFTMNASGASTYIWQPGSLSGSTVVVNPSSTTTYTITGTTTQGCTSSSTRLITINTVGNPTVTTSVTPSATGCAGTTFNLSASGASTYIWQPGSLSGSTVVVTPSNTTTYTITGTTTQGCTSSTTQLITIHTLPNTGSTASISTICSGASTTITATGASLYTLNPGAMSGTSFSVSPASTTTYTITGTNAAGCTKTATRTITVNPLPIINAVSAIPDVVSCGDNSVLNVNYNLGATTYCIPTAFFPGTTGEYISNFNFNNGAINNSTGDGPGDYNDYANLNANVNAGSSYPVSISPSNSLPQGKGIYIDYNQDGDFEDANELVLIAYSNSVATGNVAIPANALNGVTRMRVVCIYINQPLTTTSCSIPHSGEFEDYRLTISGGVAVASWSPTTFLSTPTFSTSNVNSINATTTYTVTITDPISSCTNTIAKTITVNPIPISMATTASTICSGSSSVLTAAGANTYHWNPGGSTGNTITVSPNVSTTYTVTGTNTSTGCTATSTKTITVLDNITPTITVPITCGGTSGSFHSGSVNAAGIKNDGNLISLSNTNNRGWSTFDLSDLPVGATIVSATAEFTTYSSGTSTAGNWLYGFIGNPVSMSGTDLYAACATTPTLNFSAWTSNGLQSEALNAAGIDFLQANIGGNVNLGYVRNSGVNYNIYGYNSIAPPKLIITYNSPCVNSIVNLNIFIEGYWNGANAMTPVLLNQGLANTATQCDSITVELHHATAPYAMAYSTKAMLHTNGTASAQFNTALSGSFYIVVKGRNMIETWSANPVNMSAGIVAYDFTSSADKAYGSNQLQVSPGIFAVYSGDVNTDENIDLIDLATVETDILNFQFGYFVTDINGDGNVDLLDSPIIEDNINVFIFSSHP